MTWREAECVECGNYVTYGMYHSEHEHDATEITVTVKCGYCVTGTTEEEEEQIHEEEPLAEEYVKYADVDNVKNEKVREALKLARDLYNKNDEHKDVYAQSFASLWKAVKT